MEFSNRVSHLTIGLTSDIVFPQSLLASRHVSEAAAMSSSTSISAHYRRTMGDMGRVLVHAEKVFDHWERHGSFECQQGSIAHRQQEVDDEREQHATQALCSASSSFVTASLLDSSASSQGSAPAPAPTATDSDALSVLRTGPMCCSAGVAPLHRRAVASSARESTSDGADCAEVEVGPRAGLGLGQISSASVLQLREAVGGRVPVAVLAADLRAMRATLWTLTQLEARLKATTAPVSCHDWHSLGRNLKDLSDHIHRMRSTLDSLYPRAPLFLCFVLCSKSL